MLPAGPLQPLLGTTLPVSSTHLSPPFLLLMPSFPLLALSYLSMFHSKDMSMSDFAKKTATGVQTLIVGFSLHDKQA